MFLHVGIFTFQAYTLYVRFSCFCLRNVCVKAVIYESFCEQY